MSFSGFDKKTRESVMAEYNGACGACGLADADHLVLDHVKPRSFYDARKMPIDNSAKNCQILCVSCNNVKNNVDGMIRTLPKNPIYDVRDAAKNRASWREIVENARNNDPKRGLWD